jgi:hypothetical protein
MTDEPRFRPIEGSLDATYPQYYGARLVSFVLSIADNLNSRNAVSHRSEPLGQNKASLPSRFLRSVVSVLSSPKGDQGGWEGGARGL